MKLSKQKKYCRLKKIPMFAPETGICFSCRKQISDNGEKHITSCEHCSWSYCE